MALVRVNLDGETFSRLIDAACSERRPVPMQAEVMLRRALGLPFPYALSEEPTPHSGRQTPRRAGGRSDAPDARDGEPVAVAR